MNMYVSVYKPVKGWCYVIYGEDGPHETGWGRLCLFDALCDALDVSNEWNIPIDVKGLELCPECGGFCMNLEVCDCGYKSPAYIEHQRKWDEMLAKCKANRAKFDAEKETA